MNAKKLVTLNQLRALVRKGDLVWLVAPSGSGKDFLVRENDLCSVPLDDYGKRVKDKQMTNIPLLLEAIDKTFAEDSIPMIHGCSDNMAVLAAALQERWRVVLVTISVDPEVYKAAMRAKARDAVDTYQPWQKWRLAEASKSPGQILKDFDRYYKRLLGWIKPAEWFTVENPKTREIDAGWDQDQNMNQRRKLTSEMSVTAFYILYDGPHQPVWQGLILKDWFFRNKDAAQAVVNYLSNGDWEKAKFHIKTMPLSHENADLFKNNFLKKSDAKGGPYET